MSIEVRDFRRGDWPEVARIFREGIETKNATFETDVPAWQDWNRAHLSDHRLVAEDGGRVGGGSASASSARGSGSLSYAASGATRSWSNDEAR